MSYPGRVWPRRYRFRRLFVPHVCRMEMIDSNRSTANLFTPDALLPSQFFATLRGQTPTRPPECYLLIAVLENAIVCFQRYSRATSRRERRLFKEAEQWIMGKDHPHRNRASAAAKPAFSFEYVCEILDIEPDYVRDGLRRWQAAQLTTGDVSRQTNQQ